jgi:glycosyltransferase involved in cell wall biosynthesis
LAACIARSDVVVLPYRQATQSGIIQLAFGLGTPVITTNVGGLADVVEDGQTGFIVPPEDPGALAAAIIKFFDDDLGPRFQKQIEEEKQRFSWNLLLQAIEELVES